MYLSDYFLFAIIIGICSVFSIYAGTKVNSAFSRYDRKPTRSGMTGRDTVVRLLQANRIGDISLGRISGKLTDHYDPSHRIVNLSQSTYDSSSVAAVAVAAHEMGHVMQKKTGFWLFNLRTAIVPIVNFGSRMAMPLVLIGVVLNLLAETAEPSLGYYIAMLGVILYGGSFLFALVTLPVELDASNRAKKMLVSEGILSKDELSGASQVLSAAAMTYLASLLTSLVYSLRFLVMVLTLLGRRNRK